MRTRKTIIFILLGVAAVILFVIDMATGAVPIPLNQVVAAIAGGDCPEMTARIVINIRLVKAVVALLAGAALSVSGLEMQTLFRNSACRTLCAWHKFRCISGCGFVHPWRSSCRIVRIR